MTEFSPTELNTLRAVCDTLIPSLPQPGPHAEFYGRKASDLGIDELVVELIQKQFDARQTAGIHQFLRTLESPGMNLVLGGGWSRFSELSPADRERYLANWRDSRIPAKRTGFQAMKRLTCFLFYSRPDANGNNPNWPDLGYHSQFPGAVAHGPDDHLIQPVVPDRDLELVADVCVVGSGAGGSVAAADLQTAGFSVIVLESGPYATGHSVVPREFEMTGRAFERAGTLSTDDLSFQLLAGRGAGGGTFVNWMTCLRPPPALLQEWESVYGIPGLTSSAFSQDVDSIWKTLEVNREESQRNPNNDALWRGAVALGYQEGPDFQVLDRNAVGCAQRCDFCGFGCPYGCKRSTILNFLPTAYRAGAKFLFQTRAEVLELDGHRVGAVRARYEPTSGPPHTVRVKCRVAVLAGGAIHTPLLLLRSGANSPAIGNGLRLHPTTALAGEMDRPVRCWAGPPQSVAVTRFLDWAGTRQGFWMEAAPAHPGLSALATGWHDARSHKDRMVGQYAHSTSTISLLRDRDRGSVRLDARGQARIRYALGRPAQAEVKRGLRETGRVLAAAGAKALSTLHSDPLEVRASGDRLSPGELDGFLEEITRRSVGPNRCLMFSAHLMGSCPMGSDSRRSAVQPSGELWGYENVFLVDGSVFPSAPGVNPMITIMAMARRTSRSVAERLRSRPN